MNTDVEKHTETPQAGKASADIIAATIQEENTYKLAAHAAEKQKTNEYLYVVGMHVNG